MTTTAVIDRSTETRLRDVCLPTTQVDPSGAPDEPFEYVDVSCISNETYSIIGTQHLVGSQAPSRARKLIRENDVLFATVRPTLKRIALVPAPLDHQVASTGYCVVRVNPQKALPEFVYFLLLSNNVTAYADSLQKGATYPAITDAQLLNLPVALPPLSAQVAIAGTLHAAKASVDARRREVALERERKAALLHHLFTHGTQGDSAQQSTRFGGVPDTWDVRLLDDCAQVQTGVTLGRRFDGVPTVEVPYLRVANVQQGHLDLGEIKTVPLPPHEVGRYLLQDGDVLMTEGGDFDKLGRGFIWRGEVPGAAHQNHIFAVRSNRSCLLPEFLAYLIQSPYGRAYFLSVAHKTTNLASINSTKLKNLPVPLPSISEQREIVAILAACDAKIAALEQEVALHDELFRGLLEELISGRLSVAALLEDAAA